MELDHIFILCDAGGPEAEVLRNQGLIEGTPNVHPGQGTACRRFFFETSYLELLWVADAEEARAAGARETGLWQRWAARPLGACPFGVLLRPGPDANESDRVPFSAVSYRPAYMPAGMSIDVASDTAPAEPAFFWLAFQRHRARLAQEPTAHHVGRTITGVVIGSPVCPPQSEAARAATRANLIVFEPSPEHRLDLILDEAVQGQVADFRPHLPLRVRW